MIKLIRAHKLTSSLLALVLIFNVSFAGMCGSGDRIAALRAALRASPALVNPLVARGVITQAFADAVIKDFTDGGDVALQLKSDLDAIDPKAPNLKQLQYEAVHKAYNGWSEIVKRGHFKQNRDIETVFAIADGIWVFVDAYYGDQAGQTPHSDVAVDGLSQKEFQEALDQKIKELKSAMEQPH